jgi:hypothetical protein
MLCAAPVHENTGFCGQTVSKSTSVHEIVGFGGQDVKQPGFYVEPINYRIHTTPEGIVTKIEKKRRSRARKNGVNSSN